MNIIETLQLGGSAIYPLLILGFITTVIVLDKTIVHIRYARLSLSLLSLIETFGFDWNAFLRELNTFKSHNYYRRFFATIYENRTRPAWWVESRAGDEAHLIEKELNRGQWVLETVVTAAPLIGLLGTIIGMMNSFKVIGANGLVKPEEVTGGVAQALIATALGLLLALVALFAFNYFSRRNAQVLDDMERLGTRMIDHIRLDQSQSREHETRERVL
jgi:biopolymer transport protein ExbB